MEIGLNKGRINDYGLSKTKAGVSQIFISLIIGNEVVKHYMYPFKKDGEVNEFVMQQLVYCGFDPSNNNIDDLSLGLASQILITDEDLDVTAREETDKTGALVVKIHMIGISSGGRLTLEEARELITPEQAAKIKALASKYPARIRKKKEDPNEEIPFA